MSDTGDFKARDWSVHPPYLLESYKSTVLRSPATPLVPLAPPLPSDDSEIAADPIRAAADPLRRANPTRTRLSQAPDARVRRRPAG